MTAQISTSPNILLQPSALPNQAPPFSAIRTGDYLPAVLAAIETAKENIARIKANPAEPDFENTIVALETSSELLGVITSIFYNQLSAAGTDELQALAEEIGPVTSNFSSDVSHDAALFERVKRVFDAKDRLGLTTEQEKLLDDTYKGFVRSGALLDESQKHRLREIGERQSVLGPTFANNVKKSTENFELLLSEPHDIAGLPESALEGARLAAEEKGHAGMYLFTLDVPSYLPFMQYAENRILREKIWRAYASRAWKDEFDNSANILEILKLRREKASVLGYETYAHYVLEKRMAETPENVIAFLHKLRDAYKPAALKDLEQLQAFAAAEGGPDSLQPWDIAYYSEKLKESLFDFSSEDLRPYFALENVLSGAFEHFARLFNISFKKNEAYAVWHEDVEAFDVTDLTDGSFVGTLFTDFHPREGKKNGAWKTSYRSQGLFRGKVERPVIAIVCNFTKPTKSKPSLLTHDEVLTLFHEMGHAVHGLLSRVTYGSLGGTHVLWDFVELPSQVQENWAYTQETLDLLARHYETGAPIPGALIRKLNDSKNFMVGWSGLRQVNFALLDMQWHLADPYAIDDVLAFEDEHTRETSLFPRLAGPASTSFSHIFAGGYAAGYYSYKWAEVLDADTFELFQEKGLYDRATAESYKNEILCRGGTEHPAILYKRFRGREADPDALFRREGILPRAA